MLCRFKFPMLGEGVTEPSRSVAVTRGHDREATTVEVSPQATAESVPSAGS